MKDSMKSQKVVFYTYFILFHSLFWREISNFVAKLNEW